MDDGSGGTTPEGWEADVARASAKRLCAEAAGRLADGTWTRTDLRARLAAQERRMTAAQGSELWMVVIADPALGALAEAAAA